VVYSAQSSVVTAYKVQSGLGTQATGSGGTVLRLSGGAGGRLTKAATESNEVRSDGMRVRGRHGTQKTTGQWAHEVSIGSMEPIIEAIMRDTWSAADLAITQATTFGGSAAATSVTTTTSTIVAAAGSWILQGLRVGDIIRATTLADAANNSKNLRITALTALIITVAETLVLNATPDTTFTITRPGKKLTQSGTLVKRYFTIDEYETDLDLSEIMTDFVWGSMRFGMQTNGLFTADPGGIGTGQFQTLATGTSPLLTSPTLSTGIPLSVVDATIRVNGVDVVDLTSLDITVDITPMAPDVFGSGAIKYSPDVFTGQMGISINFGCLRKDLQFMSDFAAETPYSIHLSAVENESEPKDFVALNIQNFTLGGVDKSAPNKAGGPRTQTVTVPMALVGQKGVVSGFNNSMIDFQSTAP